MTRRALADWDCVRPLLFALMALPGVGHFVHIEQPQKIAALVLEFLAELA